MYVCNFSHTKLRNAKEGCSHHENNFLGFIGDIIVSTPCTLAFRDTHIIESKTSPFLERALFSSKMKHYTSNV